MNQCYAETCGAELDLDHPYSRVYTSAQAMLDGEAPIDVVPQETVDHSNPTDPTDATLYEILNFKTNAEARAYLEQYMTPEMADALPSKNTVFRQGIGVAYGVGRLILCMFIYIIADHHIDSAALLTELL